MNKVKDFCFIKGKLSDYLLGANLDKIVIYSVVVQLCFISSRDNSYVWVSASCDCFFDEQKNDRDFFENRKIFFNKIYDAMGKDVSGVDILQNGTLIITIDNKKVIFSAGNDDSEIIWSVTSDIPEQFENHRFSIRLVEGGEIYLNENSAPA